VLVLEAPSGGWKEGVQALVAELLTSGYELTVRNAHAHSLDQLEEELEREVSLQSGVSAVVSVTRTDSRGTAWLCRRVSPCERLEVEIADRELSRSRLALAVVERLRPIDLPVTAPPLEAPRAAAPAADARTRVQHVAQVRTRPFRVWVGGGSVLSSGLTAPLPWVGASLSAMLSTPWGLEIGLAGSPLPGTTQSYAGSLSVRALSGVGFATFEPFTRRSVGLCLGLGGGTLHLQESADAAPGFDGFSRGATVAVVSARARLQYRAGPVYLGLVLDPGMLVPALKVEAGTATVLRIGRPWVTLQASLGLAL